MLDDVTLNEMKVSTTEKNWKEMGEFIEELNNKLNNFQYKKEKENITSQELIDFYQEKLIETNKLVKRNNEIEKNINKFNDTISDMNLTIDYYLIKMDDLDNKPFTSKKKKINIVDNIILKIQKEPILYIGIGLAILIVLSFYLSNIGNNEIKSLVDSKTEKKIFPYKPPLK